VAVAAGLQEEFSWTDVMVAGVVAGVGQVVGGFVSGKVGPVFGPNPTRGQQAVIEGLTGMAAGIAGAGAKSLIDGTDFGDNVLNVLPHVIGSTFGRMVSRQLAAAETARPADPAPGDFNEKPRNLLQRAWSWGREALGKADDLVMAAIDYAIVKPLAYATDFAIDAGRQIGHAVMIAGRDLRELGGNVTKGVGDFFGFDGEFGYQGHSRTSALFSAPQSLAYEDSTVRGLLETARKVLNDPLAGFAEDVQPEGQLIRVGGKDVLVAGKQLYDAISKGRIAKDASEALIATLNDDGGSSLAASNIRILEDGRWMADVQGEPGTFGTEFATIIVGEEGFILSEYHAMEWGPEYTAERAPVPVRNGRRDQWDEPDSVNVQRQDYMLQRSGFGKLIMAQAGILTALTSPGFWGGVVNDTSQWASATSGNYRGFNAEQSLLIRQAVVETRFGQLTHKED
jgi:hypothetical protein